MGMAVDMASVFANLGNRDLVSDFTKTNGYAPGDSVQRKEIEYRSVTRGMTVTPQAIEDQTTLYDITENDVYNITEGLTQFDRIFDIVGGADAITKDSEQLILDNYSLPDGMSILADFENECSLRMGNSAYISPIDSPEKLLRYQSFDDFQAIDTVMAEMRFPNSKRLSAVDPESYAGVAKSLQNMMNTDINTKITNDNLLGKLATMMIYRTPDLPINEPGKQFSVDPEFQVQSVSTDGSQITFKGCDSSTDVLFKAGNRIFLPANTLLRDPDKVSTNQKLVVTVAADAAGAGDGTCVVTISRALDATSQYAWVDSLPANNDAAQLMGKHKKTFHFLPPALNLIPLPMKDISGAEISRYKGKQTGFTMQIYRQGTIGNLDEQFRRSMLCGIVINPRWVICREAPVL